MKSWTVGRILLFGAIGLVLLPVLIFLGAGVGDGVSLGETLSALVTQSGVRRNNFVVATLLGFFPFLLLVICLWIRRRVVKENASLPLYAASGMLPILLITAYPHAVFWPLFFPYMSNPGFPHGLEFIIGPGVFAPIGLAFGLMFAWVVGKK